MVYKRAVTHFLSFIFFSLFWAQPLFGTWWSPSWITRFSAGPKIRPALFKSKRAIRKDLARWNSEGLSVQEGLLSEFEKRRNTTFDALFENKKDLKKTVLEKIEEQKKFVQTSGIIKYSSSINPVEKKLVEKHLANHHHHKIESVFHSEELGSIWLTGKPYTGYILHFSPHISKKEARLAAIIDHECGHIFNNDLLRNGFISGAKEVDPTFLSSDEDQKKYTIFFHNTEYYADAYSALHQETIEESLARIQQMKKLKGLVEATAFVNSNTITGRSRLLNIASKSVAAFGFTRALLESSSSLFTPIYFTMIGALACFIPETTFLFQGSDTHPSHFKRWMALRTIEKYLKVSEEMQRRNNEQQ